MATEDSSNATPVPQISPGELSALAKRLRTHADTIRNPAAKAAMGGDMQAAADLIDGLVEPPQTPGDQDANVEGPVTLGIDTLATVWLRFQELADKAPTDEFRDALRLAMRISDSLSKLRFEASEVIIRTESGNFGVVDVARELRRALEETAKVEA